jgi:hypothetical protein
VGGDSVSSDVRGDIVEFLRRELIGPDPGFPAQQLNGEEILRPQDPPRLRYSAGVLFPRKAGSDIAESATEAEVDSEKSDGRDGDELDDVDTKLSEGIRSADVWAVVESPTQEKLSC